MPTRRPARSPRTQPLSAALVLFAVAGIAAVGVLDERLLGSGVRRAVVMVGLAGLVGLGFCLVLLRSRRHERTLYDALDREGRQFDRESELAREGRGAAMLTFAAGVEHELSTPLGVIAMRAELIENHSDDVQIRRNARSIGDQVDRIRTHARRFLALTRGDVPLCERFLASEVVQSAAVRVRHRFERADVKLTISACVDPPQLCGDARLLEQSLVDLLLRACDGSSQGGEVELTSARADGDLIVTVADRGAEPPPRAPSLAAGRTGLDLRIAAEVLHIHRGELQLVARAGGGTRAVLRVPIDGPAVGDPPSARREPAEPAA